jgi:hypothetical protein
MGGKGEKIITWYRIIYIFAIDYVSSTVWVVTRGLDSKM